jgi:hypothetical protein
MDHEGLDNRALVELLSVARRFRLPDGTGVVLGRDRDENALLRTKGGLGTLLAPVNVPGPTALILEIRSESDAALARELVAAYSRYDRLQGDVIVSGVAVARPYDRGKFKAMQIC